MAGNNTPSRVEPGAEIPTKRRRLVLKSSLDPPPRASSSSPHDTTLHSQADYPSQAQPIHSSQDHSSSSQDIKTTSIAPHHPHSSSISLAGHLHVSQEDRVSLASPTRSSQEDSSSTEDNITTYQTIATVPVPQLLQTQLPTQTKSSQLQPSSSLLQTTQPTQLLERSSIARPQSTLHHTSNHPPRHITQTTQLHSLHAARDTSPPTLHITRSTPPPAFHTTQETQLRTPSHITQNTQHYSLHTTQNTQRKPSIVQVAVSSPLRPPPESTQNTQSSPKPVSKGGILAQALAPAGTSFRPPLGTRKPPPSLSHVIDLSDDDQGPTYKGSSSDDELTFIRKNDIRPSIFARSSRDRGGVANKHSIPESPARRGNRFKEITSKAFYKPSNKMNTEPSNSSGNMASAGVKRSSDALESDVTSPERASKQLKQMGPSRPEDLGDIKFSDVPDSMTRSKIMCLRRHVKGTSIRHALATLDKYKGDTEKAMEELSGKPRPKKAEVVDMTKSDSDSKEANNSMAGSNATKAVTQAPQKTAKRELKAPVRSIHDKWSSTQTTTTKRAASDSVDQTEPAKKKRLTQVKHLEDSDEELEFSGTDSDASASSDDGFEERAQKVLNFLNTCSVKDLADISNQTEVIASLIVSRRPFNNLAQARQVAERQLSPVANGVKGGRKPRAKKPIGDKVVDVCLDMWAGYEAVDDLVTRCEALGKPVADEMKKCGVDVYGAAQSGELELVSLETGSGEAKVEGEPTGADSKRDSGIGASTTTTPEKENAAPEKGTIKSEKDATTSNKVKTTSEKDDDEDVVDGGKKRTTHATTNFIGQPANIGGGVTLKDYQLVGLNWLFLLYSKRLSCILADEMGLGKTCQVISFLGHLLETGVKGPHLVIVPGSTLENWLREFSVFCPALKVEPYYASEKDRQYLKRDIIENRDKIDVVITTYDIATKKADCSFLAKLKPNVCVYDEGHALKNSTTQRYEQLMKIPANFRILMTGTPLQNNLKELAALLGFMLPSLFREKQQDLEYIFKARAKTTDGDHSTLLSAQRIARAKSMLTPFVLRRKKHQVLKHLPAKTCNIEYCEMTPSQHEAYSSDLQQARDAVEARAAGKKPKKETGNVLMRLRKTAIHPMLARRFFDDKKIKKMAKDLMKEPSMRDNSAEYILMDMDICSDFELQKLCKQYPNTLGKYAMDDDALMDSGKAAKLAELLNKYRKNGDRVLVFSQFTSVLDLAEAVLDRLDMQYFRLDGSTPMNERQDMIDQFCEEPEVVAFLLSTKAGGQGINLAAANKVVIIDQSFNPQEDIQAENRAHRVGQTREVEVLRLVTKGTVEENILALGVAKRVLDDRVAGEERGLASPEEEERGVLAALEAAVRGAEGGGSTG